jgi:Ribosomal protein L7/L12 C-terminal domain
MDTSLTPEQQKQLDALLFAGQKIEAIKLYRGWVETGLKEAKDVVDTREQELRKQSPQSFPAKSGGCLPLLLLAGGALGTLVWAGATFLASRA